MDYHDVLAEIGAGSAHPGGLNSTNLWMNAINVTPETRILEVGCGTGKTVLELRRRFGCQVTGVDVRAAMVKKAQRRSKLTGLSATWKVASAEHLPFPDESFDIVATESVNVFVRQERALSEYYRVLKRPGVYVDVEMMIIGPVSDEWRETTRAVYGAIHVPDHAGWKKLYRNAGFDAVEVLSTRPVNPYESLPSGSPSGSPADELDLSTPGAYKNPKVISILSANANWLESHHRSVGYGVFLCRKQD